MPSIILHNWCLGRGFLLCQLCAVAQRRPNHATYLLSHTLYLMSYSPPASQYKINQLHCNIINPLPLSTFPITCNILLSPVMTRYCKMKKSTLSHLWKQAHGANQLTTLGNDSSLPRPHASTAQIFIWFKMNKKDASDVTTCGSAFWSATY